MEIKIRTVASGVFKEVNITEGNVQVCLGLLDDNECAELARQFEGAVDELLSGIEEEQ